jgi:phosphatidylglycerophosphatase C
MTSQRVMTSQRASRPWVALFDLDGTITWHDTLLPFLWGYVKKHPLKAIGLWRVPGALLDYVRRGDRGELKSRLIRMVMGGEPRARIDAWADEFVAGMQARGRLRSLALGVLKAHVDQGDHPVLLSASPDLYVPRIGRLLGFERTWCTEVLWNGDRLDGRLKTANRRGEEKSRCLEQVRAQYAKLPVIAYGNSLSDVEHMHLAERALLVNGNAGARRAAQRLNIPVSNWG